jgi:hypothetical protein
VIVQNQSDPRIVERVRDELSAAGERWENEGGALEEEELSDPGRGAFSIDPVPPFGIDLSVWADSRKAMPGG